MSSALYTVPALKAAVMLREQSETSGGYWYKHKLEGAMYSSNLSFRKYIPRAINPPPPALQKVKVATASMW